MKKIFFLFVFFTLFLTIKAQNTSLLYEAVKAYQSSEITTAYTLFSSVDSTESITYFHDLWKYYISAEKSSDSVKAKALLYRLVQSNGLERQDFNQDFFENINLRKRDYWPTLDSLIQIAEKQKCQPFIDSLVIMAKIDQNIRQKINEQGWTDEISEQMNKIDSINTIKLQELIAEYGFPSWKLVGRNGSKQAWLIAQHSYTYMPEFLKYYRQAVFENNADRSSLAYMEDRYLVSQGRPQIYGTQLMQQDTVIGYYPIIDMQNLDQRRLMMGLPSFSDYVMRLGIDTLSIYPDYIDYLNHYYPNINQMYSNISAYWQKGNSQGAGEWYFDQSIYDFPRDLEVLALFLLEGDTSSAVHQAKKMVLCGKQWGEDWRLPELLLDSVKANYAELRSSYEQFIAKDGNNKLNNITSFDTLVNVLDNEFYPRYTFDAWNGHIKELIINKSKTLSKNNYQTFFKWLFRQVKLGNYHLFDYAELYDDVYFRLFGKSYYGQKFFTQQVPLYKPRKVNERRFSIQLPALEVWQGIEKHLNKFIMRNIM